MLSTSGPAPSRAPVATDGHLPGAVYDLIYDAERNSLWFAFMTAGPGDALYRYNIASGALMSWSLPETDHNGFLERVALAPDGSIWVTEEYQVVRFEPATSAITTKAFSLEDPDATSSALEKSDLSPGTWPAAIAFDSRGDAIIARHNVSSLLVLDGDLNSLGRISLSPSVHTPGDVVDTQGKIYVSAYQGESNGLILDENGKVLGAGPAGAIRFATDGKTTISIGKSGVTFLDADSNVVSLVPFDGSLMDQIALGAGSSFVYRREPGVIERVAIDGGVIGTIDVSRKQVQEYNPLGEAQTVYLRSEVGGMAVGSDGSLWYVDNGPVESNLVHTNF